MGGGDHEAETDAEGEPAAIGQLGQIGQCAPQGKVGDAGDPQRGRHDDGGGPLCPGDVP